MNKELNESISKMLVNGCRLELPKDEQFSNYAQVKKVLQRAGGKYNKCGFLFQEDAQTIKDKLLGGDVLNDKKKFQFFPTPLEVVNLLLHEAEVVSGMSVLEPSAGQGAIVESVKSIGGVVDMVELMPSNVKMLNEKYGTCLTPTDFLYLDPDKHNVKYDRIIANPPFTKNQDVDHVNHMYKFLKVGGVLVSIMSRSWLQGSQNKQKAFKEWLDSVGGVVTEIPEGAFKSSGTNIATVMVKITRTR